MPVSAGLLAALFAVVLLAACDDQPWNRPYPAADAGSNILFSSFQERPNHLDPAQSYSSNEVTFTGQIYEPPLQYHYLKRPYQLVPLTATAVPVAHYLDADSKPLPADAPADEIAFSYYDIEIKPGIRYQPHPAFARDPGDRPLYSDLTGSQLADIHSLADFPGNGTRELVAADYVYQIKRLAHPKLQSPIFGLMSDYIVGLKEYAKTLERAWEQQANGRDGNVWLDLSKYPLAGAEVLDRYRYRITIRGKYPQLLYWLAMPFFAPVPPEADAFYAQPGMQKRNITLDWYPVGTGPYMLTVNNPNRQMVMERNPNFHGETYPKEGEPGDRAAGLLDDAGKPMPVHRQSRIQPREGGISRTGTSSCRAITTPPASARTVSIRPSASVPAARSALTAAMRAQGIRLQYRRRRLDLLYRLQHAGSRGRRLQRARAQAAPGDLDRHRFRGIHLDLPQRPRHPGAGPDTSGHLRLRRRQVAASTRWFMTDTPAGPRRKPIEVARRLLAEAGYPDGRDIRHRQAAGAVSRYAIDRPR